MPIIAGLINILYSLPDCGTGGCCHIVTDDGNIYDDDLLWVIDYCKSKDTKDYVDRELSRTICELLLQLTYEQRCILFYISERCEDWFDSNLDEIMVDAFVDYMSNKTVRQIVGYYDHRHLYSDGEYEYD